MNRRLFLAQLSVLGPVAVASRRRAFQAASGLDRTRLAALAEAVLPSELGAAGFGAAADGFSRWLAGYRPGAELLHGYGSGEIQRAPPSPAVRWAAQLRALGPGFGSASVAARRVQVESALEGERGPGLGAPIEAKHVAVGLLAWWAGSPGATDLCYRARIGKLSCRPLAENGVRPARLG
jgi:hypothetical protein